VNSQSTAVDTVTQKINKVLPPIPSRLPLFRNTIRLSLLGTM